MKRITRRKFLRDSCLAAFLLSLPSLVIAETRHVAGLASEAGEFAKEAAHVVSTYGEHKKWYGRGQEYSEQGPRWMFWTCERCGYKDNYFESGRCEQCGECWEVEDD